MKAGPFTFKVLSTQGGICEVRAILHADGVQAAFDKVMAEAVAFARQDAAAHDRAGVPLEQPIDPDTVFELYADSIHDSVRASVLDWTVAMMLQSLKIPVIDAPIVNLPALKHKRPLTMSFKLFVPPKLPDDVFDGFAATRATITISEDVIDRAMQQLPRMFDPPEPEGTRAVSVGDLLTADFDATVDGLSIDEARFSGARFDLDPDALPSAYVDAFVGAHAGETVRFSMALGEQTTDIEAHLHSVAPPATTVVDDAFARRLGVGGADSLRLLVRESLLDVALRRDEARILREAAVVIIDRVKVPVPDVLVRRRFARQAWLEMNQRVAVGAMMVPPRSDVAEQAFASLEPQLIEETRRGLAVAAMAHFFKPPITDEELGQWAQSRARARGLEGADAKLSDPLYSRRLYSRLLQWKLVDRLTGS